MAGDGRQNFDKRTLRRMYADGFKQALREYTAQHKHEQMPSLPRDSNPVHVYIRKRPLFENEAGKEFDVVSCSAGATTVHNCLMKPDLKHGYLANYVFPLPTFSETASNQDVCAGIGIGELLDMATQGGSATCCMFGQTGSGKSYTMQAILSEFCNNAFSSPQATAIAGISLCSFEVCGGSCLDLLNRRCKVLARDDGQGSVQTTAKRLQAEDPQSLRNLVTKAYSQRSTEPTAKNESSSRSHAFYQFEFKLREEGVGYLTFVDLAGSERNADSAKHDAEQIQQSAEINSSLSVLKECFRVKRLQASRQLPPSARVPYRDSLLTKLLRNSLEAAEGKYKLVVVATVSPGCSDTEHTLSTLHHACGMAGLDAPTLRSLLVNEHPAGCVAHGAKTPKTGLTVTHPSKWSAEDVQQWMRNVCNGKFAAAAEKLPRGADGKTLTRFPSFRFKQLCDDNEAMGNQLYQLFRRRVSSASSAKAEVAMNAASLRSMRVRD